MLDADPKMEPKSFGFFAEWYVEIRWPSGHVDKVQSFRDEAHARGWIAQEGPAWVAKARGPRR